MENRKVMKLGSSSLVISLPREWIDKLSIKKGDRIEFDFRDDGSLILLPKELAETKEREVEILVSSDFEKGRLERELIGAYLGNYSIIKLKAEEAFTKEQQVEVRNRLARLTGCQIVESSSNKMVIQNLLKIKDFNVDKGLYRAYLIALSMYKDSINALKESRLDLLEGVIQIDEDVDQFYFLVLKQLRTVLADLRLMKSLKLKPIDCLDYFMVMQRIEHIADHIVNIAEHLKIILPENLDSSLSKVLEDTLTKVFHIFEGAMDSFLLGNLDRANKIINQNNDLKEKRGETRSKIEKTRLPVDILIAFNLLNDSIFRISDYATDIAEVAINRSL